MSVKLDLEKARATPELSTWPMSCGVTLHLHPYDATMGYAAQWEAEIPRGLIGEQLEGESDEKYRQRLMDAMAKHGRGERLIRYLVAYGAKAIAKWDGVLDKGGKAELEFSPEAWDLFLRSVPGAIKEWQLIVSDWEARAVGENQEEEGNDSPSGSSGTMDQEGERSAPSAETPSSPVPADSQALQEEGVTTGFISRVA